MAAVTTPVPATSSAAPTSYPREGRLIGRVNSRLAGAAALAAGILSIAIGTLQFLFPQDEDPAIDPRTRLILVMFTLSLWAFAVLFLGLARYARSSWGSFVAATGTVLLTLGTITSAANGIDLDFFPLVAMAANALWLVGVVGLTVSLVRAKQMSLWLVLPLPLVQVFLLFFSQTGGGVPAGLFVTALGIVLLAGGAQSRARRRAGR
ncbi:MAG TPA: hypothetical protein VJU58_09880 [Microbacterium sp.]|nr:hypothetical protein [Microbacterium sp.]